MVKEEKKLSCPDPAKVVPLGDVLSALQNHHAFVRAKVNPPLADFIETVAIGGDQDCPPAALRFDRFRPDTQIERDEDRHTPLLAPIEENVIGGQERVIGTGDQGRVPLPQLQQ